MIMALCPSPLYRKLQFGSAQASGFPTPSTSINTSRLSALLVENDRSLLRKFLIDTLEDKGYTVRTAWNAEEGLRLYSDCAPFSVVLIEHCVPQRDKSSPTIANTRPVGSNSRWRSLREIGRKG